MTLLRSKLIPIDYDWPDHVETVVYVPKVKTFVKVPYDKQNAILPKKRGHSLDSDDRLASHESDS